MEYLFQDNSQCIRVYLGKETVTDPYEKSIEVTLLNPIPVRAIVADLVASQIEWKMPGIVADKAKEIYVEKKHRTLLEKSQKISIKENNTWVDFEGWRVNGRMQIREEGAFLRVYVHSKHV